MHALLVLNQAAGSLNGDKNAVTPGAVIDALEAAGVRVTLRVAPAKGLCDTLQQAVNDRPEAIFVGGGDGSIAAAAGCMVGADIPLGVLPLGTLNHFARDLGLPADWRQAVIELAHGHRRHVDVGEVNGHVFINNCSIGSYPDAVRRRDALRRLKGAGKWWAMAQASFAVFRRLRRVRVRIETPGEALALRTPFVFIGNNAYCGHIFDSSLRPRLEDGRLWIYTTRAHRRLTILRLMWQSMVRSIDAADALESHSVTEATITSHVPLPLAADGELVDLKPPLHFRSRPRALQVLVPPPPDASP